MNDLIECLLDGGETEPVSTWLGRYERGLTDLIQCVRLHNRMNGWLSV